MNKALLIALAAVGVVGLAAASGNVFAQTPTSNTNMPNHSNERHQAMEKAFEAGDYEAWKNALPAQAKSMMGNAITKENFAKFSEMHELMEEGKTAEADAIRQELGLGMGPGHESGIGFGQRMGHGRMAR